MMASRRVNSGEQLSTVATLISEAQTLDANGDELVSAYSTIEQWVNYDCVCVCVCAGCLQTLPLLCGPDGSDTQW